MNDKYDVHDKYGNKVGEIRQSNGEGDAIVVIGIICLAALFAVVLAPTWSAYSIGKNGIRNIKWYHWGIIIWSLGISLGGIYGVLNHPEQGRLGETLLLVIAYILTFATCYAIGKSDPN